MSLVLNLSSTLYRMVYSMICMVSYRIVNDNIEMLVLSCPLRLVLPLYRSNHQQLSVTIHCNDAKNSSVFRPRYSTFIIRLKTSLVCTLTSVVFFNSVCIAQLMLTLFIVSY